MITPDINALMPCALGVAVMVSRPATGKGAPQIDCDASDANAYLDYISTLLVSTVFHVPLLFCWNYFNVQKHIQEVGLAPEHISGLHEALKDVRQLILLWVDEVLCRTWNSSTLQRTFHATHITDARFAQVSRQVSHAGFSQFLNPIETIMPLRPRLL